MPKIFYGSMHDIKSYPCEVSRNDTIIGAWIKFDDAIALSLQTGNADLIHDASLQLHGTDGEWIHNVHIMQYRNEPEFWKHYKERYTSLFSRAEQFIKSTGGAGDDVMVFIRFAMTVFAISR